MDYSEHAATRFKGGVVGWLDQSASNADWTRAVAEIGFSLKKVGDVSPVISRSEGVFLVRFMASKSAVEKPFEAVRKLLEREEHARLRTQLEPEFEEEIMSKHLEQSLSIKANSR